MAKTFIYENDDVEIRAIYKEGELSEDDVKELKRQVKLILERTADTPQTERIKTPDYCDICNHKGCDNCIANSLDDYCVPSGYEPTTQTETQNSNLTFEKRTMLDCYNCKRYKNDDACVECRYEPIADTPQTDCGWGEPR